LFGIVQIKNVQLLVSNSLRTSIEVHSITMISVNSLNDLNQYLNVCTSSY